MRREQRLLDSFARKAPTDEGQNQQLAPAAIEAIEAKKDKARDPDDAKADGGGDPVGFAGKSHTVEMLAERLFIARQNVECRIR